MQVSVRDPEASFDRHCITLLLSSAPWKPAVGMVLALPGSVLVVQLIPDATLQFAFPVLLGQVPSAGNIIKLFLGLQDSSLLHY